MQKTVDTDFRKKLGLENEILFDQYIVAFKVELGEFLNTTELHKFWKMEKTYHSPAVQLDEFADCLAFLYNIGLEKGWFRFVHVLKLHPEELNDPNVLALRLLNNNLNSSGQWVNALHDLFQLGFSCGFTIPEIEEGFYCKVAINQDRLKGGY